jgi:hypothetical protein
MALPSVLQNLFNHEKSLHASTVCFAWLTQIDRLAEKLIIQMEEDEYVPASVFTCKFSRRDGPQPDARRLSLDS